MDTGEGVGADSHALFGYEERKEKGAETLREIQVTTSRCLLLNAANLKKSGRRVWCWVLGFGVVGV